MSFPFFFTKYEDIGTLGCGCQVACHTKRFEQCDAVACHFMHSGTPHLSHYRYFQPFNTDTHGRIFDILSFFQTLFDFIRQLKTCQSRCLYLSQDRYVYLSILIYLNSGGFLDIRTSAGCGWTQNLRIRERSKQFRLFTAHHDIELVIRFDT